MLKLMFVFLLMLVSSAFAQSETDLLRLENLNLRIRNVELEYPELVKARDQLKAKVQKEIEEKAKIDKENKGDKK